MDRGYHKIITKGNFNVFQKRYDPYNVGLQFLPRSKIKGFFSFQSKSERCLLFQRQKSTVNDLYLKISRSSLASIYLYFACLGICVYPINLKTVEPNGPKFCVGPHMAPGKVYG